MTRYSSGERSAWASLGLFAGASVAVVVGAWIALLFLLAVRIEGMQGESGLGAALIIMGGVGIVAVGLGVMFLVGVLITEIRRLTSRDSITEIKSVTRRDSTEES